MELVLGAERHQLVVGRVELDLVDAVAVAVVGLQARRVLVGEPAPLLDLGGAPDAADLAAALLGPARALAVQRLTSGRLVEKRSWSPMGGGWFVTSWVVLRMSRAIQGSSR